MVADIVATTNETYTVDYHWIPSCVDFVSESKSDKTILVYFDSRILDMYSYQRY